MRSFDSQTTCADAPTHPLMTFFIAVFVVSLGTQMKLGDAGACWFEGLVLSLFVLIGNPIIFIWIPASHP